MDTAISYFFRGANLNTFFFSLTVATLGCVEFFIFILHKYYSKLNIEQELVFADVHFTLFFTALFNAFQSAVLAFCTTRVSERQWVRTEQLEVDHYVEIREEFGRVDALLYGEEVQKAVMERRLSRHSADSRHGTDDGGSESSSSLGIEDAEIAFEFNCSGISRSCKNLSRFLRYPHLYRKHQQLLVQVRFHELRIHFLQSNNLPLKFKVSDYLKRSELFVLTKLVHISTFAWLMLLGGVALLYYFMGIVIFITQDLSKVGIAMTWIFMGSMVFFVVLSLLIYNKMKSIFSTIMRKRLTSEVSTGRQFASAGGHDKQITNQQNLFWGGNPKFIRSIIQFMQFGFAIALSILLVFWKGIDVGYYAPVPAWGILVCVFLCNAAFVAIMAQVIPRYTLCTSLGQLVDKPRLQDTLAQWQLEEAQRKQRQTMLDPDFYDDESYDFEEEDSYDDASSRASSVVMGPIVAPIVAAKKAITGGLNFIRKTDQRSKTFEDIDFKRHAQSEHLTASTSGDSDPSWPSAPSAGDTANTTREQRVRDRKQRRKSQSVGVAVMRNLGAFQAAAAEDESKQAKTPTSKEGSKPRFRGERHKSLSGSEDIKKMRRSSSFETLLLAQLVQTDTKDLRSKAGADAKTGLMSREQRTQARRNRKKSTSDGVALMRSVAEADRKELLAAIPGSRLKATLPSMSAVQTQRRDRQRSISASASIQQMREMPLSSEEPPMFTTMAGPSSRRPRSRQSSGGVLRLEPLVEGVAADHSDSTLSIVPSIEIDKNGYPTESQARSGSPATVGSDGIGTKGTMDSASTVGDGHSDADDIPEIDLDAPKYRVVEAEPRPSLSERARYYFLSQKYRMISAVFGTVLCFFLIGMRVETFMIASCIMPDSTNTWHIDLSMTFWMETAWLCCFIAVGFYNMYVFRPGHVFSNKERSQFAGAVLDVILSTACLILLMLAESRRCCSEAEKRYLADAEKPYVGEETSCGIDYSNCCPSYGSRIYGGLGNIEPFTALVALRIIRFRLAKKIVAYMDRKHAWSDLDVTGKSEHATRHPFHPFYSKRKVSQSEKHKSLATESAVELWMKALSEHPDLVSEFGEFSSEILQVMLGIDVAVDTDVPRLIEPDTSPKKDTEVQAEPVIKSPPTSPVDRRKLEYGESRRAVDKKYSHLTPEARSIILSGQLGKHVRSKSAVGANLTSSLKPSTLQPPSPTHGRKQDKSLVPGPLQVTENEAPQKVQFDLSPVPEAALESKEIVASFAAPNARLLRSMRRCDRKLLPLLDKWTIVDVVITKWEIVYFDASDVEGALGSAYTEEDIKHIESVRQAVIATKGGKGLRLRDVAMGRKVVGHLELSHVDSVYVDRVMPAENGVLPEEGASDGSKDVQVEFWKASSKSTDDNAQLSREYRWSRVKQDRLRVQSEFGTLLLRFYMDLDESESHAERCANELETEGPLFKDNAFQWGQTIVRLCGINQLKQKLPHFGDDNDDELRDYLVVIDAKTFQDYPRHMRKKSLGTILTGVKGHANFWPMAQDDAVVADGSADPPPVVAKPDHRRRLSSFGETVPHNRRSSRMLRRLSSTGDIPSSREMKSARLQASDTAQPYSKSDHPAETGRGPDMV